MVRRFCLSPSDSCDVLFVVKSVGGRGGNGGSGPFTLSSQSHIIGLILHYYITRPFLFRLWEVILFILFDCSDSCGNDEWKGGRGGNGGRGGDGARGKPGRDAFGVVLFDLQLQYLTLWERIQISSSEQECLLDGEDGGDGGDGGRGGDGGNGGDGGDGVRQSAFLSVSLLTHIFYSTSSLCCCCCILGWRW